ncbi:hypothetical protein ACM66B_006568 [Microbotryomycetes sp. NB124-2]
MHRTLPSQSSSTSTFSSASSRVSFDVRMSIQRKHCSTRGSSVGSSSGYTTPEDDDDDRFTDCRDSQLDGMSVLDDLYHDLTLEARAQPSSPPPPLARQHQQSGTPRTPRQQGTINKPSTHQSTSSDASSSLSRWNSCASDFGLSRSSSASIRQTRHSSRLDSPACNLGQLLDQAWSPDLCFCGNTQEPESIYCSRTCAQADALAALEGGPSRAQSPPSSTCSDTASVHSSASSCASSHYRRVVNEEERRLSQEREAAKANARREKARKPSRTSSLMAMQHQQQQRLSPALQSHPHFETSSNDDDNLELLVVPPPRTSSKKLHQHQHHHQQRQHSSNEPMRLLHATNSTTDLNEFPTSPNGGHLDATPRPRDHLHGKQSKNEGDLDDYYDGVPSLAQLERQKYYDNQTRTNLGLSMLNDDDDGEEDELYLNEGCDRMSELCAPKTQRVGGHKKNKLSFDDVVGILGA